MPKLATMIPTLKNTEYIEKRIVCEVVKGGALQGTFAQNAAAPWWITNERETQLLDVFLFKLFTLNKISPTFEYFLISFCCGFLTSCTPPSHL